MLGVYIHIPFCSTICSYCDFPKVYHSSPLATEYLKKLQTEILTRYQQEPIDSIYIGGGTPTCLDLDNFETLLKLTTLFHKKTDCEFTIESNIESLTKAKIKLMKKYGVNRLSLGVQSLNPKVLNILNRHHTKEQVIDTINLLKEEQLTNFNLDLIYAVTPDLNILKEDLQLYLSLSPTHISCYSLIIEPHTLLRINNHPEVSQDLDYQMYQLIEQCLEQNNYEHYEISNYAKQNYRSKHNLNYWNNGEYYGFGLAAVEYKNNNRRTNIKNLTKYLNGQFLQEEQLESLNTQMENTMILGLRKLEGISIKNFEKSYHRSIYEVFPIQKLLNERLLIKEQEYLKIPKEHIYCSNDILIQFLLEEESND